MSRSSGSIAMRDRWIAIVVVAVGLVALTAAAVFAVASSGDAARSYETWADHLQTVAEEAAAAPLAGDVPDAASDGLLLVVSDESGRASAFAVLTTADDGSSVLGVLPASLYDLLPGYGIFPIADSLSFEGAGLAALAVENALGVSIGGVLVVPAAELQTLLVGDVPVDLPNPLLEQQDDGTIVRIAAEGDLLRSPEVVAELFTNRGDGELLAHLERQVATWDGFIGHVAADPALSARFAALAGSGRELATSLLTAARSGVDVTLVPVSQVGGGDDEGFETESEEIASFVERRMPHLALRSGVRPRAEILNGNGRLRTTRAVAEILVGRGFRIIRTDNAETFDFETTVVLAQGDEHMDVAREAVTALGTGELRLEAEAPSGIVDVSIIVGHDIPTGEG
jgi:LytR cell envelope-related transcriptional attenuator